jgi:hypothetical protein
MLKVNVIKFLSNLGSSISMQNGINQLPNITNYSIRIEKSRETKMFKKSNLGLIKNIKIFRLSV